MVELNAYFFIGAGARVRAGKKKYPEPVKNGPALQHRSFVAFYARKIGLTLKRNNNR